MEQDKILKELKAIRKEIKGLKGGQTEGSVVSVMSLFLAIGLSLFLYSASLLNEALNVEIGVGTAWFLFIAGLFIMLSSGYLASIINSKRKKR